MIDSFRYTAWNLKCNLSAMRCPATVDQMRFAVPFGSPDDYFPIAEKLFGAGYMAIDVHRMILLGQMKGYCYSCQDKDDCQILDICKPEPDYFGSRGDCPQWKGKEEQNGGAWDDMYI